MRSYKRIIDRNDIDRHMNRHVVSTRIYPHTIDTHVYTWCVNIYERKDAVDIHVEWTLDTWIKYAFMYRLVILRFQMVFTNQEILYV